MSSSKNTCTGNQFVVKTENNPLTYILTTPNLDATQHHWVESLARFTFQHQISERERQCCCRCSEPCVASKTEHAEAMKSILDRVTIGTTGRAHAHDPMVAEAE